jgi:hypothetical protein
MIYTLCGAQVNEANCGYCLDTYECRLMREAICKGCIREFLCPVGYKAARVEAGMCRGRELAVVQEFTRLHGKGEF